MFGGPGGRSLFLFLLLLKKSTAVQVGSGREGGKDSLAAKCPRFSNHNQINGYWIGGGGNGMLPRPICHQSLKDFRCKSPDGDIGRTSFIT